MINSDSEEMLPDDIWFHVFCFIELRDIYHTCLMNKTFAQYLKESSLLWRLISLQWFQVQIHEERYYKALVKEYFDLRFDSNCTRSYYLKFLNGNRTIRQSDEYWDTVKANRPLAPGQIHKWEFVIDYLDSVHAKNAYLIVMGIDNQQFPYLKQNRHSDICGVHNSTGFSYNLGIKKKYYESKRAEHEFFLNKEIKFKSSDRIKIVIDLRNASTASMKMYCNGMHFCTFENINLETNGPFYPAISLIGRQIVTIRPVV